MELPDPLPKSSNSHTPNHARAALAWFAKVGPNEWSLTIKEQCVFLGGLKTRTYYRLKKAALSGQPVHLSRDVMERLSLLLGIYKGLRIITPNAPSCLAAEWFIGPNSNPAFRNQSMKDFVVERGTIDALYTVRRYIDRSANM